jgi:hypothetical protein
MVEIGDDTMMVGQNFFSAQRERERERESRKRSQRERVCCGC